MKLKTFLFIVLYVFIFAVIVYFLYIKFYQPFVSKNQGQNIPQGNRQESIYYTSGNNLYQLDPKASTQSINSIPTIRLQSTGVISKLCVDTKRNQFFYEVSTPSKNYEIWKVNLKDNSSEKIFSSQTPGLENFTNFRDPKLSADNENLGFLASHDQIDDLFSWQIDQNKLTNLTEEKFAGTISDFSWGTDTTKIVLSGLINGKGVIKTLSEKSISDFLEQDSLINQIEYSKNSLIYSQTPKDAIVTNIATVSLTNKKVVLLTDIASPKRVSDFAISPDKQELTFTVNDSSNQQNDIYTLKTDGTDLLQVTTDGKSSEPTFSPQSDKIAYWDKTIGIFIIPINKGNAQKVLNSAGVIDKILAWR